MKLRLREIIRNNKTIFILASFSMRIFLTIMWYLPRETAHKILYKIYMGKELDFKNPKDFCEKLQWLMVHKYGKREGGLADKYKVRDYLAAQGYGDLLIKLYAVYKSADEIDLSKLPNSFVLKTNHDSGCTFLCKNKSIFNMEAAKKKLAQSLKRDYAKLSCDYHYHKIPPVILCEEYLVDNTSDASPADYKFYCFNGKADCVLVCGDRYGTLKRSYYDMDWNYLDYYIEAKKEKDHHFEKPNQFDKMFEIAEALSKPFPFVRLDLYCCNDKIYFGEFTFAPDGGRSEYIKQSVLDYWGQLLDISEYQKA